MLSQSLIDIALDRSALNELVDSKKGELDETLEQWLVELQANVATKVDHYVYVQEELESQIDLLKHRRDRIVSAIRTLENVERSMKDRVKLAMVTMGVNEIKGNEMVYKLSSRAPVISINESELPPKWLTQIITRVPDRDRIKQAIDMGEEIPGVSLKPVNALAFRVNKGAKQ